MFRFPVALQRRAYSWAAKKLPDLTKDRYAVQRGQFAAITDADVAHFERLLDGPARVISDSGDAQPYNVDFLGAVRGYGRVVLKPRTTAEVAAILRHCNGRRLAVCPQGGNTGLVGGSVPVFDEIVLSTVLMNRIESVDEVSGILVCEAGCVLERLDEHVNAHGGLCMPLDLGAKGSCHIGGNVSTNAGGLRLLRYGNLHGSVLGVEAVLANGNVLDLMSNFKKDNTGYHLKHMFIGSEGTLGVVTRVAVQCSPAPRAQSVAFLALDTYAAVLRTFRAAKRDCGEILSACEMIDAASLEASTRNFKLEAPVSGDHPFYMLIETSGSNGVHDEAKMSAFLEATMASGDVVDGTVTADPGKVKQIWQIRERVPDGIIRDGYCFKYDISLPLAHFYDIVPAMRERVGDLATRVCGYGHIGDSNLHLNVSCAEFTPEIYARVEPFVYEYVASVRGSISAEHGIGFLKPKYLKYSKSGEALRLMASMKALMDPNGILNPYKVLPEAMAAE